MKLLLEIIKSRRRAFMAIFALCFLNVSLYAYVAFYQDPRLAPLRAKWLEKRELFGGGGKKSVDEIYRQGKTDLVAFNSRIPLKKDFARVMGELFNTAANNSLSIGGLSYKPEPLKGEGLLVYNVSFNVVGKYAAVKSFISDIMAMKEITAIESLSLNSGSATAESVDLKLQLGFYFRTEGQ